MITKDQVINSLREMPAQFSIDELMDKLILLQKIDIGLEQSRQGDVYSSQEAKEMLKQWPPRHGQSKLDASGHRGHIRNQGILSASVGQVR